MGWKSERDAPIRPGMHLYANDCRRYMLKTMNAEELDQTLRHCHAALRDTLVLISELLNQKGDPDEVIKRIEQNQAKYNAITRLLREHDG